MAKMEMNRQEKYLNRIDRLKLMDDDFFSEALDGKIEAVEFILQVVLERDDLKVIETKAQVEYKSATKRSIRLDIKAVDRENEHALFGDGLHILYVNGEYRNVDTPVGRLMHDFHCTKSEDMYSKVLADEVKYLKETEGGRGHMCRILEEMCEEVEKETAERVEKETAERVEKETAERVEKETAERVAKETARSLLALGKLSYEDISQGTGLPLEVVEELASQKTA